jgi:protein involved in polysaccharide export with SLBB domain
MKKIVLLVCIILPLTIISQELSDAYLESLPESVKEDVLKGIDDKKNKDKAVYKRPSTMVGKDESEFSQYKEFKDSKINNEIKTNVRFGKSIFESVQTSFMPINEPNLDGSYILDIGDILEVQIVGQKAIIEELPVNRDGSINIPEIGKVFIAGLSLESASALIKNKIESAYIGVNSFVTLINVRDIQILITGNAYKPGMYTLNGNSSMLHAISMAGGVNDNGSYREINLIRNNKLIASLDLYDIFIYGYSNLSANLRSGDTIYISQHKNLVHAVSGVNRPMIYELNPEETLMDLVGYANGLSSIANIKSMVVEGIVDGVIQTQKIVDNDLQSIKVNDNDSLIIEEFVFGKIEIKGAVKRPGFYKVTEETTLSDILKRAGGFKPTAYPFGGHLNNKKTALLNQDAKEKLYNNFIKDLITGFDILDDSALEILESLKQTESSGRIMAEFDISVLEAYPQLDTRLNDGDEILIPYKSEQVYVYGETNSQGTVKYKPGKSPDYYINNAGGYLKTADTKGLYIIHPNGETISLNTNGKVLGFINSESNELVYPGSIIFVPQKSNLNAAKTASIWAPIISSIALSLTSLSVLNNSK